MAMVSAILGLFSTGGMARMLTSSVSLSTPVSVPLMVVPFCVGWQAQSSAAPASSVSTFFFICLYRF